MKGRVLILLLFVALFVPTSLVRGYWNPDEGRYGEVAREVWQGRGALVPHLAGEVYTQKPPLFFWLVAGAQMVSGGHGAPASRIPSALATLVTALLLFSMVKRSYGEREGLLAAAVYLSSGLVIQMGQWIGIDAVVTALVTGCMFLQQHQNRAGRRPVWATVAIYVLLAAIVLAKVGPVLIAILGLAGVAWLEKGWRGLLPRHLLFGVPLFLLLLAAWAVPAGRAAGVDYLWGLTGGQAGRIADSSSHEQAFYYYLLRFPPFFLPWLGLVPAAIVWARSEWRQGGPARREAGRYLLWFVLPFLAFSLFSGKRERYILPIFPAAAAMAAVAAIRLRSRPRYRSFVVRPLQVTLGVLGVLGLLDAVSPYLFETLVLDRLEGIGKLQLREIGQAMADARAIALLAGLSAVAVTVHYFWRKRRDPSPATPLCAAIAFLVLAVAGVGFPALDFAKSYEPLVRGAEVRAGPEARYGLVRLQPGPFCLALGRDDVIQIDADDPIGTAAGLLGKDPELVLFARRKHFNSIASRLGEGLIILVERRVGRRELVAFRRN